MQYRMCDIVVVGPPAGGDGSDIEGMSDDESEGQMSEEVACLMETITSRIGGAK